MIVDRAVIPYARSVSGPLARTTACTISASVASIVVAFALASATSHILAGDPGLPIAALVIAAVALAVKGIVLWLRDLSALDAGQRLAKRLRQQVLDKIAALGPGYRWRGGPGSAHLLVVDGCEHIKGFVGNYLPQLVAALVIPATLVGILAFKDVVVALVIALTVAAVPLAQRLVRRILGERAERHWLAYERYADKVADSVSGLETLAGLGTAQRRGRRLVEEAENLRAATTSAMNVSLSSYLAIGAAMLLGTAGATSLAAWNVSAGRLEAADAVLILFLSAECFRPLNDLQSYWHEGFYGINAARQIDDFLHQEPPVRDEGNAPVGPTPPEIRIHDVSFRYPGAHRDSLTGITATIPAAATTAIVGASGAGKSTLVSLLLRDYDPTSGAIAWAQDHVETDLRNHDLTELRRASARVSQEVMLLDGTLRQNILDASPDADSDSFAEAITRAGVEEFLPALPNDLDSPVGEGGRLLSGGQRQRVALARAFLRQAPFIALDEATSALDGENEALITQALRENQGRATIVVVAHRLSTVRDADHVIVLGNGGIVEQGSPRELEATDGAWAQMVAAQDIPALEVG